MQTDQRSTRKRSGRLPARHRRGTRTSSSQSPANHEGLEPHDNEREYHFNTVARSGGNGNDTLANALGWFSVGLGVMQLLAPRRVARIAGIPEDSDHDVLMRAIGIREIASGVGVLSGSGQFWMKTRLGGDAMDLALMSRVMRSPGANRNRAIAATVAVAGIAALDALSTRRLGNESNAWGDDGSVDVFRSITINRSPEEVYRFWHDFGNLPRFMHHLEAVQVTGTLTSHWVAKAPFGREVEWDAEIVEDRPGELIAWRSIEGSEIPNSGSVRFSPAPNGRGTEVSVTIQYEPPAGKAGALLARMLGEEPHVQLRDDLRRLKQVLETGDVVVSEGSPKGTGVPLRKQRAAQPLSANAELQTQP